jgi:hypothetical protein
MPATLPEGFVLDKTPELPEGFVLDSKPDESTPTEEAPEEKKPGFFRSAWETVKNIGKVYPAAETAANLVTSSYGVPASGLVGLFALPFGLETANKAIKETQKALIYQPQTEGGKQLTEAATYPLTEYEKIPQFVGNKLVEAGYSPEIAATVHSALSALPALVGAKYAMKKAPASVLETLDSETSAAIKKGMNKAIRPSVVKKSTSSQVGRYFKQAESAIGEIVKNKDNLKLVSDTGAPIEGLPKTLYQFSQAIEQTKRNVFAEYDSLAKQSDAVGTVKIDLSKTADKLKPVMNNKVLKDLSPETIKYAEMRAESLKGRGNYTAVETQEAIQMLNQTLEQFYRDPSPDMKGKALIDSVIANDLRAQLDSTIEATTGKEYSALKKKYGDLKAIESDVTKRSIVDARKNNKGLIDFSDILSGSQVITGMMSKDPVSFTAGMGMKGISKYYKWLNDPNQIVKNMFSEVEKLTEKKKSQSPTPRPSDYVPLAVSSQNADIIKRYENGELNEKQVEAFNELRRRGKI